ncbi:MAG: CbiX/SirB N-terminal domain-containing protein [Gallionella sp.]|nr:CbiX/SirB N-terminal domain-containing protein [Gallionella sp.]MDD4947532.1 CbiX/SirB N-terminal domain-containing protein [Gallionella sp.]
MSSAIILFAHGARDPEWAQPFFAIRQLLQQSLPDTPVCVAFLDCMQPELDAAVEQLLADGINQITLIPMFLARGGHLKEDLPKQLGSIRQRHPQLTLHVSSAIGEEDAILRSLADWVEQEHQRHSSP